MPTPSLSGSRLPRMFPTANWGVNVSAPEHQGKPGSSAISSIGSSAGASNLSDSVAHLSSSPNNIHHSHHSHGATSRKDRVHAANAQNQKIAVLEQYIHKFPLKTPTTAPPIATVLEGSGDSAVRQRTTRHYQQHHSSSEHATNQHNASPAHQHAVVKFAEETSAQQQDGEKKEPVEGGEENENDENNDDANPNDEDPNDDAEESAQKRAEREISSKRQAREAAKQSYELLRRQKVDSWIQMAERNLRKVRRENETLTAIAKLTQANALVNDERYEKALESLRAEAELADELRQAGFGPMMHEFAERIDQIQRNMDKIVVEMNKRTVEELATLRENFEKELEKFNKELEDERNSGLSTKLDWIQKNRELHRAVTEELFVSDDLARSHVVLETLHRRRRLEATLVVEESELLEETVEKTRRHNDILKDKLGTLECELSLAQAKENRAKAALRDELQEERHHERLAKDQSEEGVTNSNSNAYSGLPRPTSAQSATSTTSSARKPSVHHHSRPPTASSNYTATSSSGSTDEAVAQEAQTLFDRISQTISVESRNLQTARHAHVEALKQRTELEVYLKHAILAYQSQLENLHYSVRSGIKAESGGTGVGNRQNTSNKTTTTTASYMKDTLARQQQQAMGDTANFGGGVQKIKKVEPTVFTVEDRQSVVDSLLSLPRVLTLMFDPVAAASRVRRKQERLREERRSTRGNDRRRNDDEAEGDNQEDHQNESDHEEEDGTSRGKLRATADAKLFDDLAKLGVDVVGARTGFMFQPPPGSSQEQHQQSRNSNNNNSKEDPQLGEDEDILKSVLGQGSPNPPDEEELWKRWNQWSDEAEKQVNKRQQKR